MSLTTKVYSSFWSDEDTGSLSAEQKLAVLWILTNRDTNNLGYVKVTPKQFIFDTGLPFDALKSALEALTRTFVTHLDDTRLEVLALGYIRFQFSDAVTNPKNNIHTHLCRMLLTAPSWVQQALLSRYQGLARTFSRFKGLPTTLKGPEQSGAEPHSTEQSRAELGGSGGDYFNAPTDEEVLAFALKWPGELASGAPTMPLPFVQSWLARMNARSGDWPRSWERALVASWRQDFRAFGQNKNIAGAAPSGIGAKIDLRTRLKLVEEKLRKHPAAEDCGTSIGPVTDEEQTEFDGLQRQASELKAEIMGDPND